MGRYVYESGNFVWKYAFGEQPSEQSRIAKELGIGKVWEEDDESGDVLQLKKQDADKLWDYLNEEVEVDLFGETYSETRLTLIELHNKIYKGFDMIACYCLEEKILKLVDDILGGSDIWFWCMVKEYAEYIGKSDRTVFEFYGEY